MKTVYYSEKIQASPKDVHEIMIDKDHYKEWTKPFSPTSDFRGYWDEDSKIFFTSTDENGNVMGMISMVDKNIPGEIVIIRHIGMFNDEGEQYAGKDIDNWKNVLEVYRFKDENGYTNLVCSVEISDEEDFHMFDETWPQALKNLKEICERKNG